MAMTQHSPLDMLARVGVVPIVVLPRVESALPLARMLTEEGLPIVEIACRSPAALPAIRLLREKCADLTVGAGTVLSAAQAQQVVQAGAQFLLAPGHDPATLAAASALDVPMLPGVLTPTEVAVAAAAGIHVVKLFPATLLGGVSYLRALHSVYPDVRFVPTGGITQANLAEYLSEPNVICCAGSWLAPAALLREERWDEIRARIRMAVTAVRDLPLKRA